MAIPPSTIGRPFSQDSLFLVRKTSDILHLLQVLLARRYAALLPTIRLARPYSGKLVRFFPSRPCRSLLRIIYNRKTTLEQFQFDFSILLQNLI
jgi:hypothetical protein